MGETRRKSTCMEAAAESEIISSGIESAEQGPLPSAFDRRSERHVLVGRLRANPRLARMLKTGSRPLLRPLAAPILIAE